MKPNKKKLLYYYIYNIIMSTSSVPIPKDEILYWQYERVDPERSVDGANFDNGEIIYKKFMSTAAKINLAKSYFKLIIKITKNDGTTDLDLNDDLAPAYLATESLFKSMYYRINNVVVSEIGDYCAQISALNQRINYSKGYRDSVLKDMNFGKVEFSERQKAILSPNNIGGEQTEEVSRPGAAATTATILGIRADATAAAANAQQNHGQITFSADTLDFGGVVRQVALGDKVRIGNVDYTVISIQSATQGFVYPNPGSDVAATAAWQRVRRINESRGTQKLEVIWRPSLGIFQKDEWILGHDFEVSLFPHSDPLYKKFFMESLFADKVPGTNYEITVDNLIFYPCIGYIEHSIEQGEYSCDFLETRMQIQNITSSTDIDRTFVIDQETRQITMALQDARATSGNTLFPRTKFKVGDNSAGIETDLDLKSYVILYDIYQFPRPQHDQESSATVDRIAQAYYENLSYSGQHQYLPDMEDYEEWKKLGPYYRYKIPIRKGQSNPKLSIRTSFRNAFSATAIPNLLLFDTFRRSFKLIARHGRVIQVLPQTQAR